MQSPYSVVCMVAKLNGTLPRCLGVHSPYSLAGGNDTTEAMLASILTVSGVLSCSPLPKKKSPEFLRSIIIETDLRPISLIAVLCKEMEDFVVKWVWDIVEDRVDQNQYVRLH